LHLPTRLTIRRIADIAETLRAGMRFDVLEVEHIIGERHYRLSKIRFARNGETGKPTKRFVDCIDESGDKRCFDGRYELVVTRFTHSSLGT
jgi:hypothetical protein